LWSHGSENSSWTNIDAGGADAYYEVNNQNQVLYTAPLILNPSSLFAGNTYTLTLKLGDGTTAVALGSFQVESISERKYRIEYSYQTGYDLFSTSVGYDLDKRLKDAFEEAGTIITRTTYRTNLTPETLSFDEADLERYGLDNSTGGSSRNPNVAGLFGVANHNGPSYIYGRRVLYSHVPASDVSAFCFAFVDKIYNGPVSPGTDEPRQFVDAVTIHELGHGRGKDFSFGSLSRNITDVNHTAGHNGSKKRICVMRVPGNPFDPDYRQYYEFKETLKTPLFCSGHKQMLLNLGW
jgi:hypothetical protein